MRLYFIAEQKQGRLHYNFKKTVFLGIQMPKFMSPQILAFEQEIDGKYYFIVGVNMFLIGRVIAYSGELDLEIIEAE